MFIFDEKEKLNNTSKEDKHYVNEQKKINHKTIEDKKKS